MGSLQLQGFLQAGGSGCGGCGSGSGAQERLGLLCGGDIFETIVGTDSPIAVRTSGAVGQEWVDLPLLAQLRSIEFLYVKSNAPIKLRLGAGPATLEASSALPSPLIAPGEESFDVDIDGVALSWGPNAGSYTRIEVVNALNGLAAAAGLPTPRFAVSSSGVLTITGVETDGAGVVEIVGGDGGLTEQLGFAEGTQAFGEGEDLDVLGTFLVEFPRYPAAPSRVQVSGNASITILAAGRTSG